MSAQSNSIMSTRSSTSNTRSISTSKASVKKDPKILKQMEENPQYFEKDTILDLLQTKKDFLVKDKDAWKKQLDLEIGKMKDQSNSFIKNDRSFNEAKKMLGFKKMAVKKIDKEISIVNSEDVMGLIPAEKVKKPSDREKLRERTNQLEEIKKENVKLKKEIQVEKEQNRVAGWEIRYLTSELSKFIKRPYTVSDQELQSYINENLNVKKRRNISFDC